MFQKKKNIRSSTEFNWVINSPGTSRVLLEGFYGNPYTQHSDGVRIDLWIMGIRGGALAGRRSMLLIELNIVDM